MPDIRFDGYYRYAELSTLLKSYADEYPKLIKVDSIGKSYEGRDIWVVTVTNSETGPAEEKPALWCDGNIHASEVSPSTACLYLINKLTTQYGTDADVTRCLDTRAFYICPRMNPDGAEWALADIPKIIRSSTRPYPYDEEPIDGLVQQDMDSDGRMLMMRIEDPNGNWKASDQDSRLMIRRDPTEIGGKYYRIMPEGRIDNYDGVTIHPQTRKEALDMNRNFPFEWRGDWEQFGAGPYPTSEPEVHAVVEFLGRHRNVTGGISFHTWSGAILRPYGTKSDEEIPVEDLWTFKKIGDKGTELSGYPNVSVFHDFKYHPKEVITGVFDDWLYDHFGLYAWTVEIWSPQRQAGIEDYKFIEWYREHPVEDDLKMLRWSDEKLDGKGYINWYEFDHPQLGRVELGGWNMLYAWRNPPPQYLEKEVAPFSDWAIWHLLISPKLEIYSTTMLALGGGNYKVEIVVHNTGWLPTYISKQGLARKATRGVIAEIELPDGALLKTGKSREMGEELEGRSYTASALTPWGLTSSTSDRAKFEWIVYVPQAGIINISAKHDRAGIVRTSLTVE